MCGITGVALADPNAPGDLRLLRQMTDIIRHRGPDGEGFHCGPGIGLGMRRLSIIDLAGGDQPLRNEDGSILAICNGEIYNFIELREELLRRGHTFRSRSDVEVIVHLYEEEGVRCLQKLRGMFALALWDGKERQLFLARDRLGIKPLNYAFSRDGSLWFGSEIKSILMADPVSRQLDPDSVEDLFTFGYVLAPRTLFKEVKKLLPGHYLLYRNGRCQLAEYWDVAFSGEDPTRPRLSAADWSEALADKFAEAVRLHLRSDVPVAAWLSAGIDSSAVVAQMAKATSKPVQTFSLGFSEASYDEISGQKILSDFPEFGLLNHRILCTGEHFELLRKSVWHAEDPNTSGLHILQLLLAGATRPNFKVVLTGEGSDENLAGYPWYQIDKLFSPLAGLPRPLKRLLLLGPLLPRWKPWAAEMFLLPRPLDLPRFAHLVGGNSGHLVEDACTEGLNRQRVNHYAEHPCLKKIRENRWSRQENLHYLDLKIRLPDFITHGLDRISMSQSLEVRVPFLDHEFVELCAKIPASLKLKGRTEKFIFREAMKPYLPAELVQRRKRGLRAPHATWLQGHLPAFAEELLSESLLKATGYFKPATVRRLLEAQRRGDLRQTRALMAILCVQTWDDLFVRGCRPGSTEFPA